MPWTPLPLGAAPDVTLTTAKKRVVLALAAAAVRRLGWSEAEPNLAASLGDHDNAGWLRLTLDEDGATPETDERGRLVLTLPRSALPDLQDCRAAPLSWRGADAGGIDVRLPTVAARARPAAKPRLAVNNAVARASKDDEEVVDEAAGVTVIAPPELYAGLHREAWAHGVELHFLSDGNVVVNGRVRDVEDVESLVRGAVEARSAARSRAG